MTNLILPAIALSKIDIENMKMWPPILEELKNTNPKYREQAAWVCGTATQNNPKAQAAVRLLSSTSQIMENPGPLDRTFFNCCAQGTMVTVY